MSLGGPSRRFQRRRVVSALQLPIGVHDGSRFDFLRRFQFAAREAAVSNRRVRQRFARELFRYTTDYSNLMCAIDHLATNGGKAPGPDGVRIEALSITERRSLARNLSRLLRSGEYLPGPFEIVHVPKASGTGTRPITLFNAPDRVVQRAIAQTLQPFLDPTFSPISFGFRPGRGRESAIAYMDLRLRMSGYSVVIADDLRDAFTLVPHGPLLDILRSRIASDTVVELVRLTITNRESRGIPQGASHSPELLNLYSDHLIDRPWARVRPDTVLIRWADDLLAVCSSRERAIDDYAQLSRMLQPTGMELKGSVQESVVDLADGGQVSWMGFEFSMENGLLVTRMAARSWNSLGDHLQECQLKPNSPLAAQDTIRGWVDQLGPCASSIDIDELHERIIAFGHQAGFEELPSIDDLARILRAAEIRYEQVQRLTHASSESGPGRNDTPARPRAVRGRRPRVRVYADGACCGASGIGGWAFIMKSDSPNMRGTYFGSFRRTTNNRMELTAVIRGLEAIQVPADVLVVTDSRYVSDGLNGQLERWAASGWKRGRGRGALRNPDLWQRLWELARRHRVTAEWVRAHAGHQENEECDALAAEAIRRRLISPGGHDEVSSFTDAPGA